jgi:hypothetical protein
LIQQVAAFAALCEGYLGIEPNHILWKYYFFGPVFLKSSKKGGSSPVYISSCVLQLHYSQSDEYIPMKGFLPTRAGTRSGFTSEIMMMHPFPISWAAGTRTRPRNGCIAPHS